MPSPGLSLVGFLNREQGIAYLQNMCVFADANPNALETFWQAANQKLGPRFERAGHPEILAIPAEGQAHLNTLIGQPWVKSALQTHLAGAVFQYVELEPLLAYQMHVDMVRSDHHNGGANGCLSTEEIFLKCLPLEKAYEGVKTYPTPNSLLITSEGFNFYTAAQGVIDTGDGHFLGMQVGALIPLLHVVRFNGRCYLHNGFHRAVGLAKRGITHAPCVFRDVAIADVAGIRPPSTFGLDLLESENPPTIAHYSQGRACEVSLKVWNKALHVTWNEYYTTRD
jgi:hypothetical protein